MVVGDPRRNSIGRTATWCVNGRTRTPAGAHVYTASADSPIPWRTGARVMGGVSRSDRRPADRGGGRVHRRRRGGFRGSLRRNTDSTITRRGLRIGGDEMSEAIAQFGAGLPVSRSEPRDQFTYQIEVDPAAAGHSGPERFGFRSKTLWMRASLGVPGTSLSFPTAWRATYSRTASTTAAPAALCFAVARYATMRASNSSILGPPVQYAAAAATRDGRVCCAAREAGSADLPDVSAMPVNHSIQSRTAPIGPQSLR